MRRKIYLLLALILVLMVIAGNFLEISFREAVPPNMMLVVEPAPASDVLADSSIGQTIALTIDSVRDEKARFCYINTEPVTEEGPPIGGPPPIELRCQPVGNLEEGVEWLRQETPTSTLLSTHYSGSYYTGSQLWLTTSHEAGCTDGSWYKIPDLGSWNDLTSSVAANTSAGCHSTTLYDYSGYGGAQITATPALGTLGAMDNAANSVKIRP